MRHHVFKRIIGVQPEIDDRGRALRQNIFLDRPLQHGRRRCCADHRIFRPTLHLRFYDPLKEPQICKCHPPAKPHIDSRRAEEVANRRLGKIGFHLVFFKRKDRPGQSHIRTFTRRG